MGLVIAYTGAHPILVSLSMMIFLRGLGEFLTRGGDISGFPDFIQPLGHGSVFGIPIPLLILIAAVVDLAHPDDAHAARLFAPTWSAPTSRRRAIPAFDTQRVIIADLCALGRHVRASPASSCWRASIRCASATASPIC